MKTNTLPRVIKRQRAFTLLTFAIVSSALVPLYPANAAEVIACTAAVSTANQELQQRKDRPIRNEKGLVKLLETLNRDDVLPPSYITTHKAKELGWSGKGNESLWNVWVLNNKAIGGDVFENKALPGRYKWYSADIESVRGYRSPKQLVYSPQTQTRYLTTDYYQSWVKIPACE